MFNAAQVRWEQDRGPFGTGFGANSVQSAGKRPKASALFTQSIPVNNSLSHKHVFRAKSKTFGQ